MFIKVQIEFLVSDKILIIGATNSVTKVKDTFKKVLKFCMSLELEVDSKMFKYLCKNEGNYILIFLLQLYVILIKQI